MRASSYFPAIDAMAATVADGRFDIRQAEGGEQYRNRSHRAASFIPIEAGARSDEPHALDNVTSDLPREG
jgi:hypothetical protein